MLVMCSCGADGRLGFVDGTGKVTHITKRAHENEFNPKVGNPISKVKFMDDRTLISGGDEGIVKVWDLRAANCVVFEAAGQPGSISGMHFDSSQYNLITSCSDGTVAIYDMKQGSESEHSLYALSDSADEEIYADDGLV